MAGTYVEFADGQPQNCVSARGRYIAFVSLFVGCAFVGLWIDRDSQHVAAQEPINTMSMKLMQPATGRMQAVMPWTGYQPQSRSMPYEDRRSAQQLRNVRVFDGEGAKELSPAVSEVMGKLKTMTLLEASQLVSAIEEEFGVDASASAGVMMAPMAAGGAPGAPGAAAAEEKTTFDVVLEGIDDSKRVAVLKAVRAVTGLGLKETKDFLSALPKPVKEGASKEDAEALIKDLVAAGGKAKIV
jgi:large subunit ribosomal protein L7/L12